MSCISISIDLYIYLSSQTSILFDEDTLASLLKSGIVKSLLSLIVFEILLLSFSCSVVSDSLQPCRLQHVRLPIQLLSHV